MARSNRAFPDLSVQEEEAIKAKTRDMCRDDLHYLAKHVLGYNKVTDHYHKRMAMDIDTPKYRFKLLLHPRGHYKSTLGTEARAVQKLLRNPNERILITNAKLDNSRKFLRAITRHFESNARLRWAWRDWWLDQYASEYDKAVMKDKLDWIVRATQDELILLRPYQGREASITTGAVDSSLVSQHYSTIIADDLVNREYVRTPDMVEKSKLYFKDLLDLLDPDGDLEIIGTRWSHYDLYSWIIKTFGRSASFRVPEGYVEKEIIDESKKTPENEKDWMISIQPCRDEEGKPVFPEEFTDKVLSDLAKAKGPYEFGAQYELNPTSKENQKFHEEWFKVIDVMPDPRNLTVCITVDPAKSLNDQADDTAMVVCGYDSHNRMYFLDGVAEKLTIDELPDVLWDLVTKWSSVSRLLLPVGFEAIGFQETYVYNIERMMRERNFFFPIEPIKRRTASKEERILRLVPRVKNEFYVPRQLIITPYANRGAPYDLVEKLKTQLILFPFAGHDDVADALADQLDIVCASGLPTEVVEEKSGPKPEFVHRSILEDKRKLKRHTQVYDLVR